MKFLKENWFKLMTGTSMLVFSFAFLMYAVSPSYANEINNNEVSNKSSTAIKGSDIVSLGIYGGYAHYIYADPSGVTFYKHRTTKFIDDGL